jgi:hypothetical protein
MVADNSIFERVEVPHELNKGDF